MTNASGLVRITAVMLVDASGRILMQLRDDRAQNYPGQWGLPGGHCEPGETDEETAVRELLEETALRPAGHVTLFERQVLPDLGIVKSYFYATTTASQEDVVIGEGAAMIFLHAKEIFDGRSYTPTTLDTLRRFMSSPAYERLIPFTPHG